jgi:hypothetical protein
MTLMEPQAYAVVAELIIAQLLLPRIYQRLTKAPPVMVVIDEADYLCSERLGASYPEGYSCSGLLAKQGRGFQVSGCFSVSLLGRVSDFITNNSTYFFTYMQPNYQALAEAAKTLLMRPEGAPLLGSLPTGVCVYRDAQGPCSFPMLARMDLNPGSDMRRPDHFDQHPFVPDMPLSELPDVLEALRTTAVTQNREQRDDAREEQLAQHDLPDLSRKLLDLASVYPFMPVGRLWGKLGDVSPETKVKARKRLELEKLAEFVVARCGSHSRQLMFPTEKGWQLLGKNQPSGLGKGKLPHRSFCHWLRDWHVGQGHKVDLEWLVPGTQHSADLAYTVNGVTHCIEVIVDCVENITSHLQACFVKSSAVASVTIVVAQKAMLKGIQAKVASETSLFEYMSRIRFDVIDPYVPKE